MSASPGRAVDTRWRRPGFRRLWLATSVSQVGTQVSELAIPLAAISLLHASAFVVGALAATGYLPIALLGLPAGVWVDRLPRRSVLVAADLARAVALATIPLASVIARVTLAQLFVVVAVVGSFTVFFDVAYPSYLPSIVPTDELAWGNSRLQVSEQGAAVAGPGFAGWLVGAVGASLAVGADALSYVVSALLLGRIAASEQRPDAGPRPPMRAQVAEGIRYVRADRRLAAITLASGLVNLFGRMVIVVLLIYLVRSAGYSAPAIGAVFAVGSVGFVVGAATADRTIERVGLGRAIVLGGCVASVAFVMIVIPPAREAGPFVAVAMFVYGLGALTFTVGNAALRQLTVPRDALGRVTSSMRLLVWVAQPIAGLLGGWLATVLGLRVALWAGAVAALTAPVPLLLSGLASYVVPGSVRAAEPAS